MRFLLVEFWHSDIYAEPIRRRLLDLGHEVLAFKESQYFQVKAGQNATGRDLTAHLQHKFRFGPRVVRLNFELLATSRAWKPDVVVIFRGDLVWPSTLAALRQDGVQIVTWHNDDPFSPSYPPYQWRHARAAIPYCDRIYAYRVPNIQEFAAHGAWKVSLLRSFYIRELHFPLRDPVPQRLRSDVAFVGHWENDGRDQCLLPLLRDPDIRLGLWGTLWDRSPLLTEWRERVGAVRPLYGLRYNQALNGTKIALVFLSKLNRDTYTRRTFEIPATRTLMLSEYSEDLAGLYTEGREADYFRSPEELHDKVRYYLRHDGHRRRVAEAGYRRLMSAGHEALDRARTIQNDFRRG